VLVVVSGPFVTMIETEVETGVGVGVASNDEKKFIELLRVCDTTEPLPVEAGKRMLAVPPEVTITGAEPVKVAETVVGVILCVTEDRNESAWDIATEAADGITTSVVVIVAASAINTDALDRASHTASCWSDSTMSASSTQKIIVGRKISDHYGHPSQTCGQGELPELDELSSKVNGSKSPCRGDHTLNVLASFNGRCSGGHLGGSCKKKRQRCSQHHCHGDNRSQGR
jgi:hypothetical protein